VLTFVCEKRSDGNAGQVIPPLLRQPFVSRVWPRVPLLLFLSELFVDFPWSEFATEFFLVRIFADRLPPIPYEFRSTNLLEDRILPHSRTRANSTALVAPWGSPNWRPRSFGWRPSYVLSPRPFQHPAPEFPDSVPASHPSLRTAEFPFSESPLLVLPATTPTFFPTPLFVSRKLSQISSGYRVQSIPFRLGCRQWGT